MLTRMTISVTIAQMIVNMTQLRVTTNHHESVIMFMMLLTIQAVIGNTLIGITDDLADVTDR